MALDNKNDLGHTATMDKLAASPSPTFDEAMNRVEAQPPKPKATPARTGFATTAQNANGGILIANLADVLNEAKNMEAAVQAMLVTAVQNKNPLERDLFQLLNSSRRVTAFAADAREGVRAEMNTIINSIAEYRDHGDKLIHEADDLKRRMV